MPAHATMHMTAKKECVEFVCVCVRVCRYVCTRLCVCVHVCVSLRYIQKQTKGLFL